MIRLTEKSGATIIHEPFLGKIAVESSKIFVIFVFKMISLWVR